MTLPFGVCDPLCGVIGFVLGNLVTFSHSVFGCFYVRVLLENTVRGGKIIQNETRALARLPVNIELGTVPSSSTPFNIVSFHVGWSVSLLAHTLSFARSSVALNFTKGHTQTSLYSLS